MARNRWAIVLAAGEGARIRALTTDGDGRVVPKQYWAPHGTQPMLQWTLERAGRIVPIEHLVTIVAASHRSWWRGLLTGQPQRNIIVQPDNRGTGIGLLLPLLRVYLDDPEATVCVLPSDHYVEQEDLLRGYLERAFEQAENGGRAVLLGMTPERPDPDYGWIVPGPEDENGTKRVVRFVEKPDPDLARSLFRGRASWSSLMLAAKAEVLLEMFRRWAPRVMSVMGRTLAQRGWDPEALRELYAALDPLDFSRDILEKAVQQLRVLVVPPCGWTDLGTPERLAVWMAPRFQGGLQETPIVARTA